MQLQWKTEGLPPEKESIGFHHIYLPIWRLYATDRLVARKPESPSSRDKTYEMQWEEVFARSLEALWQRYSNQTLSEVKTIQARGIASILSALMTDPTVRQTERNIDAVRAYKRVAAFFQRQGLNLSLPERELFEQRFNEQPLIRRVVADISAIEQQVEESYSSRVKLESLIGSLFADNKSVRFSDSTIKVVARDQDIGLASLSAGEKQVLWLFIQVLRASSHSLLIDEPEISLHIDWQRQLVASMRQLNQHAQLVLASHSPEIMAEVPDEHIISL
jgi:predicted ATP-binding protein involved in virulence